MTYRSAYPAPIQPMDAHDRAFANRNAPPKADKRGPWPFLLFRTHPQPRRGAIGWRGMPGTISIAPRTSGRIDHALAAMLKPSPNGGNHDSR